MTKPWRTSEPAKGWLLTSSSSGTKSPRAFSKFRRLSVANSTPRWSPWATVLKQAWTKVEGSVGFWRGNPWVRAKRWSPLSSLVQCFFFLMWSRSTSYAFCTLQKRQRNWEPQCIGPGTALGNSKLMIVYSPSNLWHIWPQCCQLELQELPGLIQWGDTAKGLV